jgi:putative nucleotidyltransferase with HDIG domain
MNLQPVAVLSRLQISLSTGLLGAVVLVVILFALRDCTYASILPILVTTFTFSVLDRMPIHLDPHGELYVTTVIAIPTLVLFGWQPALIGAAIGMTAGLLNQPGRHVIVQNIERLASLIVAASVAAAFQASGLKDEVAAVVAAGLGYTIIRTLLVSSRMHSEEAISWGRAVGFLVDSTFFHLGVFTAVAAVAVWAVSNDPSTTTRLIVPVLASAVTLQLYLPRILRGQEQRRVLSAVSVLAAAVDAKDPYTADHSAEVADLSRRIARILNLDEPEVHRVYLAGLLHDIGKTIVPPEILLKPGKLTSEEWKVMRSHVEAGVRIVESIGGLAGVAPIVAANHEQLDGRGYPLGLKGEDIPLGSRINIVVDAYNALTTNRPYREARSSEAALEELERNSGTQFDPRVISALRAALTFPQQRSEPKGQPTWLALLRQPAFGLLWFGELVSFIGDNIFFVALTLWVLKLTGSATILATALIAATVGQGLLGLFAGAATDRIDRRGVIIASDVGRALLVAALPFILLHSIPGGLILLALVNVGTVFFRTGVFALIPSIVAHEDLLTANALFQTTQRIGEMVGSILGGVIVVTLGYHMVFYLDALSFLVSAACVASMPVLWRAGLDAGPQKRIAADIGEGLRYIWRTPIHRVLALLIIPGYLTLAFDALQTPMVVGTAGLSAIAYGVINSFIGVGKFLSAIVLSGTGRHWVTVQFTVVMFVLTAIATELFGSTRHYAVLIIAAILFGAGNVATNIANATLSMANAPPGIIGRLMASRQVFVAAVTAVGMLVFGRIADVAGPPIALVTLGFVSGVGVLIVWLWAGRLIGRPLEVRAPSARASTLLALLLILLMLSMIIL